MQCFAHCVIESLNMIRRGKLKADLAIRQVKLYMPPDWRDAWTDGINICKDSGNNTLCRLQLFSFIEFKIIFIFNQQETI